MNDKELEEIISSVKCLPQESPVVNIQQRKPISQVERNRRLALKKKKQRRKRLAAVFSVLAVIVIIISVVIITKSITARDELTGTWKYDEVTIYYFDGKGHGELQLPLNNYEFSYTAQNGTLSIDFVSEEANDAIYTFTVQNDTLTLISGSLTFELHKK